MQTVDAIVCLPREIGLDRDVGELADGLLGPRLPLSKKILLTLYYARKSRN